MTNRNRITLESEILDILDDVDRLADECKHLGGKIKRLRLDVESGQTVPADFEIDNLSVVYRTKIIGTN